MPVRQFTKEQFEKALQGSKSIKEVLTKLGVKNPQDGGNYKAFYRAAKVFKISISGFGIQNPSNDKGKRKTITDQQIKNAVLNAISYEGTIRLLNLRIDSGTNNTWIRNKIKDLSLDISHFLGQGHLKGKTHDWSPKIPMKDILVEDSNYGSSSHLSKRLVKEGMLVYECAICKIKDWKNKPISLHLDHIDGCNTNNQLSNLRLLCPNCHSLTPTFRGKNK